MYLNIHTHNAVNQGDIQNYFPQDTPLSHYFSIGIHPWFIAENWDLQMQEVIKKSQSENCKLIGECGLDKNVLTRLDIQTAVFEQHILLSEEIKKPLIIHCVKSFSEVIALHKRFAPKQMWILHGFQKNEQIARELLKNNIKLSFGKAILYKIELQKLVFSLSDTDFFLETDDSSIKIEEIYEKSAQIRNISVGKLKKIQLSLFNL